MHVIEAVLAVAAIVLVAVAAWAVLVYASPERDCRWCRAFAYFHLRCARCKGTRRTWRLGARKVHELKLSLQQAWAERP
jgi:hypothetical protein